MNSAPPAEAGDPNGLPAAAVVAAPFGCPNVNGALVAAGDCGNPDTLAAGDEGWLDAKLNGLLGAVVGVPNVNDGVCCIAGAGAGAANGFAAAGPEPNVNGAEPDVGVVDCENGCAAAPPPNPVVGVEDPSLFWPNENDAEI